MKKLIIATALVVSMGGIVTYGPMLAELNKEVVEQQVIHVPQEVEVDQLQKAVDRALEEADAELKAKAQASYDSTFEMESKKIELEVRQKLQAEQGDIIENLEKEVGTYWKSKANLEQLVGQAFPEDPQTAKAIVACESGFNINAVNDNNPDGWSVDGGLWQINSRHDDRLQTLGLDKYDPEDATVYARLLYEESGWQPWVCYTKNMLAMS